MHKKNKIMEKGILHLHLTVIVIFLLTFTFKTLLLLANNMPLLDKVRAKTKILEMVVGTLILLTGGYLLYVTRNAETYMIVKIILVMAAIPLGIIGIKKNNKLLAVVALLIFIYVYGIAETRDLGLNIGRKPIGQTPSAQVGTAPDTNSTSIISQNQEASLENAKAIYTKLCIQCHGPQGDLGAAGAKNLSVSLLSDQEKEHIITNGKGLMAPFKYSLSEQEIKQLVQYVDGFKK